LAPRRNLSVIFFPSTVRRRRRLFVAAWISADRSQPVWCKGDEIGEREATRYVLDIGIESAVFVNDEHDGKLFLLPDEPDTP